MIIELGHFCLILAGFVAMGQVVIPLIGTRYHRPGLAAIADPAAQIQFLMIVIAWVALTWAFVTSDFSVQLVAENSHSAKPMIYKISGVWGNHEGSMLLWVLILTGFGAGVATFGKSLPSNFRARALAIHAAIGVGFLWFIILTSNPFTRLVQIPAEGRDLNPLLQDPGLAFHPPFLYLGYVGFSLAFSFAIAALIEGKVDAAWARWVRPWTLLAWCSLTLGVGIGSWWAYYELGWGGWWFWDPVENASLLPWLLGTALLHSLVVVEKRGALKNWTMLLAILTFSMSLIGTFLVRSGILSSVHAFATDPARGVFILALLSLTIGGSLGLFLMRAPSLKTGTPFSPISREGALVLNNLVLCTATATVFVGTIYPLILDVLDAGKVSVGPAYFNATFGPLMIPLLVAVPVGAILPWKKADLAGALQRLWIAGAAALLIAAITAAIKGTASLPALCGIALSIWIIVGALVEFGQRIGLFRMSLAASVKRAIYLPRSAWGMTTAHAGLGVLLLGIVSISAWREETIAVVGFGESITLGAYDIRLDTVSESEGPNYISRQAQIQIFKDGRDVGILTPSKRFYPSQQMWTTESATRATIFSDLYIAMGDARSDTEWALRVYLNPMVNWMWVGVLLMSFGGVISMTDQRLKIGAKQSRRKGLEDLQPQAAGK